jgi:hypothetical protein
VSYPDAPGGTAIRREFAELIRATEKAERVNRVTDDCCGWHGAPVPAALLDAAGDVADGVDGDAVGRGA